MQKGEDIDQLQLLEEKLDSLIKLVGSLRREKESLSAEIHTQEQKIQNMNIEVENLRTAREKARLRVISLLEKIEQADL